MDELVICEVSVKENSIHCHDVKPDGTTLKPTICSSVSQEELIVPDIVSPVTGTEDIIIKKEKEDHYVNSDSYSEDLIFSCKEDFLVKEENPAFLVSENSETDSQPSEAELQSLSKEIYRKRSQEDASISMSSAHLIKRSKLRKDSNPKPGTSAQLTTRERKARIQKAPSSSTSAVSQDNHDSDFGLHCSEDSSGLGPCGSQEGSRLGDEASSFNAKTENFPSSDELLYCVDCKCAWEGDCPEHGPLLTVLDTVVSAIDNSRARRTAPSEVMIDETRGVVSVSAIPNRTRFGPLEGTVCAPDVVNDYTRPIFKYGKHVHSIDSSDPATSNWMRFVRRTEDDGKRNLDAYQFKGQIYFRTISQIFPGEQLVVGIGTSQGLFTQYLRNESYVTERHGEDEDDDYEELQDLPSCSNDEHSRQTSEECGLNRRISKEKPLRQKGRRSRRSRPGDSESSPDIITRIYFVCSGCSETFTVKQSMIAEKRSLPDRSLDRTLQGSNGEGTFFGNGRDCNSRVLGDENNVGIGGDQRSSSSDNLKEGVYEELLICSECNQVFGKKIVENVVVPNNADERSSDCDNRLTRTHPDEKSSDGDSRTTKSCLEARSKTNSTHKRVHVCPVCSEQFIGKRPLNKHMRTHINQKPYVCPHCNQGFARKFTLNMHIRTHTREKPYECPECNKCFAISVNLRTHMKIHAGVKPYVCTECNRSFARKSHLDGHMQIHNGEKTFVCPSCGHKFFHKHNLIKHLRTHSKEQPFGCPECHERFSYKSHFKKHLRIHTGGAAWTGPIVKDQQGGQA